MDWHSTEKLRNGLDPRGKAKELHNEDMKRKGKATSSTTKHRNGDDLLAKQKRSTESTSVETQGKSNE